MVQSIVSFFSLTSLQGAMVQGVFADLDLDASTDGAGMAGVAGRTSTMPDPALLQDLFGIEEGVDPMVLQIGVSTPIFSGISVGAGAVSTFLKPGLYAFHGIDAKTLPVMNLDIGGPRPLADEAHFDAMTLNFDDRARPLADEAHFDAMTLNFDDRAFSSIPTSLGSLLASLHLGAVTRRGLYSQSDMEMFREVDDLEIFRAADADDTGIASDMDMGVVPFPIWQGAPSSITGSFVSISSLLNVQDLLAEDLAAEMQALGSDDTTIGDVMMPDLDPVLIHQIADLDPDLIQMADSDNSDAPYGNSIPMLSG
eukprot:1628606-Prymnesium_polylepis.1